VMVPGRRTSRIHPVSPLRATAQRIGQSQRATSLPWNIRSTASLRTSRPTRAGSRAIDSSALAP
jgi:hypothetical protein